MMRRMMPAAALALAVSTPVPAQDKAAIQQLNDRLAEAFNTGDAAGVAAMYTQDAVVLPPGMEMIRGRDDIQAMWQGAAEQMGDLKLTTTDVKPLGDSAVREIGTATAKTDGGQPQDIAIKYVVIWEKVGDEWKIATDIWNTNQ
jgi:uncharacterized protein (TIGR02246 family)